MKSKWHHEDRNLFAMWLYPLFSLPVYLEEPVPVPCEVNLCPPKSEGGPSRSFQPFAKILSDFSNIALPSTLSFVYQQTLFFCYRRKDDATNHLEVRPPEYFRSKGGNHGERFRDYVPGSIFLSLVYTNSLVFLPSSFFLLLPMRHGSLLLSELSGGSSLWLMREKGSSLLQPRCRDEERIREIAKRK